MPGGGLVRSRSLTQFILSSFEGFEMKIYTWLSF
jgi:hypothetical protein